MEEIMLFTDGSVNTQTKIGYGAYLAVSEHGLTLEFLKSLIKVKRFENTSSTKLELQTLLWALNDIHALDKKIIVYTDSQNIVGLKKRRERFEKNDYSSKNNKLIANHELYQEFYRVMDIFGCELVKVQGHQPSYRNNPVADLFKLVDKASRNAQREDYV